MALKPLTRNKERQEKEQHHLRALHNSASTWMPTRFPFERFYDGQTKADREDFACAVKHALDAAIAAAIPTFSADNEWETRTFSFSIPSEKKDRTTWNVVHEKLRTFDSTQKGVFKSTKFQAKANEKLKPWVAENPEPPVEAVQLLLARRYVAKGTKAFNEAGNLVKGGDNTQECLYELWNMENREQEWNHLRSEFVGTLNNEDPKEDEVRKMLEKVLASWKRWQKTDDEIYRNKKNTYASTSSDEIYRKISDDVMYILVDQNDGVIAFLDPNGIDNAYGLGFKAYIEEDTDHLFALKPPKPAKKNVRHKSQSENLVLNRHLTEAECGTDIFGSWHALGHEREPVIQTSEFKHLSLERKDGLLTYFKGAHGLLNRLVVFWFQVLAPQLQKDYSDAWKAIPDEGRLPPTCEDEDETFCMKVLLRNQQTNEHIDANDWNGGLVGLVQIGDFTGGSMGRTRTAFDFTTHESVRQTWLRGKDQQTTSDARGFAQTQVTPNYQHPHGIVNNGDANDLNDNTDNEEDVDISTDRGNQIAVSDYEKDNGRKREGQESESEDDNRAKTNGDEFAAKHADGPAHKRRRL
ncbi:MAG: hypothetical protein Q9166_004021 [cf. Caloplaca sp. 2 TL-2023]